MFFFMIGICQTMGMFELDDLKNINGEKVVEGIEWVWECERVEECEGNALTEHKMFVNCSLVFIGHLKLKYMPKDKAKQFSDNHK